MTKYLKYFVTFNKKLFHRKRILFVMCHLKKHGLMEKAIVFFELLLHFFAFASSAKRFAIANVFLLRWHGPQKAL